MNEAAARFAAGDLAGAEAACRARLAERPGDGDALHLLGLVLARAGRYDEAIAALGRAVAVGAPGTAPIANNLGEMLRQAGRLAEAAVAYRLAVATDPGLPEAWFNLGITLKALELPEQAITAYLRATELRPDYAKAHYNLGNVRREEGRSADAEASYRAALRLRPDWLDPLLNLGAVQQKERRHDEAVATYRQVLERDRDHADARAGLAAALSARGDVAEARGVLGGRGGDPWHARLRAAFLIEPITPDPRYPDEIRAEIVRTLDDLGAAPPPIDLDKLPTWGIEYPSELIYHGHDERPLKQRYARFLQAGLPRLGEPAPRSSGPPRMGILLSEPNVGVFLNCMGGLVERLGAPDLSVTVAGTRATLNPLRERIDPSRLDFLDLPDRLGPAADRLRAARFDALWFWEIGTDAHNSYLPLMRLAPRQVGGWGWPVTSGAAETVDVFLSCARLEPPEGSGHYSERLVALPSLPTWYRRPRPAPPISRSAFGMPEGMALYVCHQRPQKWQPDFDAIVAEILERDPTGRLAMIGHAQPQIGERLLRRLRLKVGPEAFERIHVFAPMEHPRYLGLLRLADVALDTTHYGGGANTLLDAIGQQTPFVSWAGPFHRGRWGAGILGRLGLDDLIVAHAADYASRAVAVATDPDRLRHLRGRLAERGPDLFEEPRTIAEHRDFFGTMIGR